MLACQIGGGTEYGLLPNFVDPGSEFFPANAVVECQPVIDFPAILGIDAREVSPVVQLFVVSLLELVGSGHETQLKVRHGIGIGGGCVETEAAIRLEIVGYVEFAQLVVTAECEVVLAFDPVQVVVEGVVVAKPAGESRRTWAEVAGDTCSQIRARGRLPDILHTRSEEDRQS